MLYSTEIMLSFNDIVMHAFCSDCILLEKLNEFLDFNAVFFKHILYIAIDNDKTHSVWIFISKLINQINNQIFLYFHVALLSDLNPGSNIKAWSNFICQALELWLHMLQRYCFYSWISWWGCCTCLSAEPSKSWR